MFNKSREISLLTILKIMKTNNYIKTQLKNVPTEQGESIEEMLRRLIANNEPIPNEVPPIYTPLNEGVIGDTDIRHDRFDTAIQALDKFAASDTAKSAEIAKYEPKSDDAKKDAE